MGLLAGLAPATCLSQTRQPQPRDTTFSARRLILQLPAPPTDFDIDAERNLYFVYQQDHRFSKYFEETAYDSAITIGGKSLRREGLNNPVKVSARNRQAVFLLDEDNRRLLRLNPNLRVLDVMDFMSSDFQRLAGEAVNLIPQTFSIAPTGAIFVLNYDDNHVYKFDLNGRYRMRFGGLSYGAGSLPAPRFLGINHQNQVFVGSQAEQAVKVFNLFGVYQYSLPAPAGYQWAGMDVWGDFIVFVNKSTATIYNRLTQAYQTVHFEGIQHIRDLALTAQGFYVLSANKLYLYSTKPQ